MKAIDFEQLISVGCGIDVHKDVIVATIRRSSKDYETRQFSAYTSSAKEESSRTNQKKWYRL